MVLMGVPFIVFRANRGAVVLKRDGSNEGATDVDVHTGATSRSTGTCWTEGSRAVDVGAVGRRCGRILGRVRGRERHDWRRARRTTGDRRALGMDDGRLHPVRDVRLVASPGEPYRATHDRQRLRLLPRYVVLDDKRHPL